MSAERTCGKCGDPIESGQFVCSRCGAVVEIGAAAAAPVSKLGLPDIGFPLKGLPGLDMPGRGRLGSIADLRKVDVSGLEATGFGTRAETGRSYRAIFAIGQAPAGPELRMPFGIARTADGSFFIVNRADDAGTVLLQLFGADGQRKREVHTYSSGTGRDQFDTPVSIAADAAGNLWVADMGTSSVKRLGRDGEVLAVLGTRGTGPEQLTDPRDLAVDAAGNLYIADTGNNRVVKWDVSGRSLRTLGINRMDEDEGWLMSGDEPGQFDEPQGVTLDGEGNLYVADTGNQRIQKFNAAGEFLLEFGEEGDGAGQFRYPRLVRAGPQGDVFVADSTAGRLLRFDGEGRFAYQVVMPSDAGMVADLAVDEDGRIIVVLRHAGLILCLEVQ
jgi:DNA-binding beta-propeller fold protein YncE